MGVVSGTRRERRPWGRENGWRASLGSQRTPPEGRQTHGLPLSREHLPTAASLWVPRPLQGADSPSQCKAGGAWAAGQLEWPGAVQHGWMEGPQLRAVSCTPRGERHLRLHRGLLAVVYGAGGACVSFPKHLQTHFSKAAEPGVSAEEANHVEKLSACVCVCPPAEGQW